MNSEFADCMFECAVFKLLCCTQGRLGRMLDVFQPLFYLSLVDSSCFWSVEHE